MAHLVDIRIVFCDDWEALYVDDEFVADDHRIRVEDLVDGLNYHADIKERTVFEITSEEISQSYVEEDGLPDKYSDIPEDAFLNKR